jgi:hypothetical protein
MDITSKDIVMNNRLELDDKDLSLSSLYRKVVTRYPEPMGYGSLPIYFYFSDSENWGNGGDTSIYYTTIKNLAIKNAKRTCSEWYKETEELPENVMVGLTKWGVIPNQIPTINEWLEREKNIRDNITQEEKKYRERAWASLRDTE